MIKFNPPYPKKGNQFVPAESALDATCTATWSFFLLLTSIQDMNFPSVSLTNLSFHIYFSRQALQYCKKKKKEAVGFALSRDTTAQ